MKNIAKIIVLFVACALVFSACSGKKYDGYTYIKKYDYYYKLHAFADAYKTAHPSDVVTALISFSLVDADTAAFCAEYEVVVDKEDTLGLPLLLLGTHTGDSMSFIVPTEKFVCDAVFPEEFAALALAPELKLSVNVLSVLDSASFQEHKKELALWKKTKEEYEQYQIKQYLKKHRVKFVHLKSGIYKRILKQGRGKNPKFGDVITITYQGSLLNGEIINHFTTMDFSYGTKMQVIEGLELAIKTMKKGERAQIIVPSKYAWGEEGLSNGAIAPYTPIVFDIELKKISR